MAKEPYRLREATLADMEAIADIFKDDMRVARAKKQASALGTPYYQADDAGGKGRSAAQGAVTSH